MKSVRSALQLLLVGLGVVLLCLPVFSQAYSGTISGIVTDQSGGAIAGATVTVTDVDRGVTRTLTTDSTGAYSAPNLTPGKYSVRAEFKGFKAAERSNLTLEVAQSLRADMSLQPGEQTQTVTVTEQAPVVNVTDATLGGTLQPGTIQDLPLNGRNFMNLLQLRPGVTIYPGGGAWTQSTNGMRPEQNYYMLDGVSGFEPFSAQSTFNSVSLSGDTATLLPLDAIQEFNVEENPKAEFGWKPGAIVNIALRSGTNSFHGSGDAFGRTDALDATNPFVDPTLPRQTVDVINFGADVGGPIKKDKAFFFVGYAGQRYSIGNPAVLNWPTLNPGATVAQGGVIAACNAVLAAGSPLSQTSLTVAGLNGDCTRSTGPTVFQNVSATESYLQDLNTTVRSDNGLAKVDWHLTDKHSLTLRMFIGNSSGPQVNSTSIEQPQWRPNPFSRDYTLGANETWIASSNVVNEVRFGLSRFTQAFINGDCDSPLNPTLNQGTGICGFTNISISGFSGSTGCCSSFPKYQGPDSTPELIDHVSVNHGNHAFKFGVELRDDIYNGGTFSNSRGVTAFAANSTTAQCPSGDPAPAFSNALENFMAGCLNSSTIFVGSPLRHVSQWAFAGFGQDDWRLTPRLTVNLGLRYEYVTPIKESDNRLANFDPNVGLFQVGSIANINLRNNPYLPDKNNLAPRLGFAWDVMGNGKWVVRGGGGISYVLEGFNIFLSQQSSVDPSAGLNTNPTGLPLCTAPGAGPGNASCTPGPGNIVSTAFNINASGINNAFGNNWNQSPAFNGGTIFPGSNTSQLVCQPTAPCNITSVQQNMVTPYVTFWSLGVEHAFTNNLSLDLGYVGNHGTKLLGIIDQNQPVLGSGYCLNITAAQAAAANALTAATGAAPACPGGVPATPASLVAGGVVKVSASAEQASRPFYTKFPYYGYIYSVGNYYESNYDGLQATLTQRVTHGLSATIGYTFSHALDDASNDWSGTGNVPQNPFDTAAEYSNSTFDITHRFTATLTYELPGRSGFGQMLEGWKVTSIVTLESALPWGIQNSKSSGADPSGTGEYQDRWNYVGNYKDFSGLGSNAVPYFSGAQAIGNAACVAAAGGPGTLGYLSLHQYGCYQLGNSVMTPPAIGSYGDMTRNTFRGNGIHLWDASVMKDWRFKENLTGEFRFEVFNLLNHTQYGNPEFNGAGGNLPFSNTDQLGQSTSTPDVTNNNPSIGSGAARTIQLGFVLKF